MKKLLSLFLTIGLLVTTYVTVPQSVEASSCSVGQYEVLTAQRGAGFSFSSCHDDLADAEVAMNALANDIDNTPVIRVDDVIVKMAGGIIDVSDASISSAINIYSSNTATSASHSFNGVFGGEMGYMDSYIVNGSLVRVKGMISGLDGWINDASYVELVPTAHLDIANFYYMYDDTENGTKDLIHARTYNKVSTPVTIGPAPAWMVDGTHYYSFDGINFYSSYVTMSTDLVNGSTTNKEFTNYNYFQYLSSRTRTNYTAIELDSYLEAKGYTGGSGDPKESVLFKTAAYFIKAQEDSGVNALMEYAWALHESAYGTSTIAKTKNNIFGIGAVDSAPLTNANPFTSVEECISYHAKTWVSVGYSDPITDSRYYGASLGNKVTGYNVKYATDPYWGEGIAGQMYRIDKHLGFKDLDYYSVGILNNEVKDVIYNAATVYKTNNGSKGFSILNYPVTITGENGANFQIMMDAPMRENEQQNCTFVQYNSSEGEYLVYDLSDSYPVGTLGPICDYDFKFQAEVTQTNISIINNSNYNNPSLLDTHIIDVYETAFDSHYLTMKARNIVRGVAMDEDYKHYRRIIIKNSSISYDYPLHDVNTYAETINAIDYTFAGFETSSDEADKIDITSIADGTYEVYIETYDSLGNIISLNQLSDSDFVVLNNEGIYGLNKLEVSKNYRGDLQLIKSTSTAAADLSISNFDYSGTSLTIAGSLSYTGIDMTATDTHYKKLIVKDSDGDTVRDLTMTNVDLGSSIINGIEYPFRGFTTSIADLDQLSDGDYTMTLELYNAADELLYTEVVNKDDFTGTYADHLNDNVKYSVLDKLSLTLNKLDLDVREIVHVLKNASLSGNILHLDGYAFMNLVDNDPATLKHKIILKNDAAEYEFEITSDAGAYDLTDAFEHGVDYSMSWFIADIDLDTVVPGDYKVLIDVSTDSYHGREELLNSYRISQPSNSNINAKSMELYRSIEKFGRLELTIAQHNMLFDPSKESTIETVDVLRDVRFNADSLIIEGYAFMASTNVESISMKMYLVGTDGSLHEMTKNVWDGVYDLTEAFDDGYTYGNPWYQFTIQLSTLPKDTYVIKAVLFENGFEYGSEIYNKYNKTFETGYSFDSSSHSIVTNAEFRTRLEIIKE